MLSIYTATSDEKKQKANAVLWLTAERSGYSTLYVTLAGRVYSSSSSSHVENRKALELAVLSVYPVAALLPSMTLTGVFSSASLPISKVPLTQAAKLAVARTVVPPLTMVLHLKCEVSDSTSTLLRS